MFMESDESVYNDTKEVSSKWDEHDEDERVEFREFCQAQERIRQNPGNSTVLQEHCAESDNPDDFKEEDLIQIFSLFVIFLLGVVVRIILKKTKWSIPYTVVLMVLGLIIGLVAHHVCPHLNYYTAIARTKPEIILMTFLPVLIFESAFSISVHTLMRSATQILIVALPGMLISTFLTAAICICLLQEYRWSFIDSSLFGSIISATDPVAVVAILRELGASETLSVLVEGESLLNDGVAVLLFEIFKELLETSAQGGEEQGVGQMMLHVCLKFVQIAIGGPVFGFFMGKLAILSLSKVYNDPPVEVAITLASTYLTYFIGEEILGVSGIMAVVVLGVTLSSERTCISPESEKAVHHFWEMLGYLANTVLFVLIGIIIGERALSDVDWVDGAYLIALYGCLNLIRLVMLVILSPFLRRIGYGLEWKSVLIMTWGGLRGAVGLCLALEIYENPHLCDRRELGSKILFQTAGVVFLTLVVNATTTKKFMELLKVTKVSDGKMAEMENALKILKSTRMRAIAALKSDRFVANSNWNIVKDFTFVGNPYAKLKESEEIEMENVEQSNLNIRRSVVARVVTGVPLTKKKCLLCENARKASMTILEYQELAEEARLRVLKALKISFWRQYQQGILKGLAVQILIGICDRIEDSPFKLIGSRDISKYWEPSGCFPLLQNIVSKSHSIDNLHDFRNSTIVKNGTANRTLVLPKNYQDPLHTEKSWKRCIWWLGTRPWFTYLMDTLVVLSVLLTLLGVLIETVLIDECGVFKNVLISSSVFITLTLLVEVVIKVEAVGIEDYLSDRWHFVDLFVLALTLGDIVLAVLACSGGSGYIVYLKCVGFLKIVRILRVFVRAVERIEISDICCSCSCLPVAKVMTDFVSRRGIEKVYLGYEIGKGYVTGVEQVFKLLPMMPDETRSLHRLKGALEREKMEVVRELGKLQRKYPEVAVGAKTRHACRAVLNQMKQTLDEMASDGLLDEKESDVLLWVLEKKMKNLSKSPASIAPASPETILENLNWFKKENDKLKEFVLGNAVLLTFVPGDHLYSVGDSPKGVYVIATGLVKIQFVPSENVHKERKTFGVIPNCELLTDLKFKEKSSDVFSSGSVIGEVGFLKNQERAASVICETFVSAYYFSNEALADAAALESDVPGDYFDSRIWRSWGVKVATALLVRHPEYDNWSLERIQGHLEKSTVPVINTGGMIEIPGFISDVIVIEGYFQNYDSKEEIYTAPCIVPKNCTRIFSMKNPITINRVLMISHEDIIDLDVECLKATSAGSIHSRFADTFGNVDGFTHKLNSSKKGFGERLDIRQRRRSIAITNVRKRLGEMKSQETLDCLEENSQD